MAQEMNCSICTEKITKQPHKKQAKCPYCDLQACVSCVQTYLVGTHEDPHCMGCRRGWSHEILSDIVLTTWMNGAYKLHRQNVLLDRERSRLPAAQIILSRYKQAHELIPQRNLLYEQMNELRRQLGLLEREFTLLTYRMTTLQRGIDPDSKTNTQERKVFVMPCPASGCRGFLSTAYKCGVCDVYCCPDCHEIKGINRDADHTCDPNTVESVRAIKKDTRPCPDCGTNIFKIEGCSQMFCTNCNTPFDWVTGRKVTSGNIHNPHYFEYVRTLQNGVMPRNPGDIPCAANLPTAWEFERNISRRFGSNKSSEWLYQALNNATHIYHVEIRTMTNGAEDIDNTEHNVRFLAQEITETRWKQLLQQREKRRLKRDEIRQLYEAFVGACVDIFGRLIQESVGSGEEIDDFRLRRQLPPLKSTVTKERIQAMKEKCETAQQQLTTLAKLFNQGLMQISKRYKCQVLQLDTAYGLKRETRKYAPEGKPRRVRKSDGETVGSSEGDNDGDGDSVVIVADE